MRCVLCMTGTMMLWATCAVFVLAFTYFQFGGGDALFATVMPGLDPFTVHTIGVLASFGLAGIPAGACVVLTQTFC